MGIQDFYFLWLADFSHSDKNIYWSLMMFEGGLPWVFNLSHDFAVAKSVKEKNLRKTEKHLSKIIQRVVAVFVDGFLHVSAVVVSLYHWNTKLNWN